MSHSFTNLIYHIIFSTQQRLPLLNADLIPHLRRYASGILANRQGSLLACGGMPDHLHLLSVLHQDMAVSEAARLLKSNTSRWLSQQRTCRPFAWQRGYAAFTVSPSQVERVRTYINHQPEHHRKMTMDEELERLFRCCKSILG